MSNRVYFQTTKFIDINVPDLDTMDFHYGYRIYDDYMKMYDNTMMADEVQNLDAKGALELIKKADATDQGTGIIEAVALRGGFVFNDDFIEVEEKDGKLQVKD